jgi:RNA polymerase sigma-70 factor (ECF subfamily)
MGTTAELNMCQPGQGEDQGDGELVTRFRAGEGAAFDRLVLAHQGRVVRLTYRLLGRPQEVDDVVQEVFLSVLENLRRFRGECRFSTWLTRIVVNKCRSHQRWRLRRWRLWLAACRFAASDERWRSATDDSTGGRACNSSSDATKEVARAVDQLPAKYREPVVLHYFEDLSIAEIAQALELSANAVEVRLTRARQKLKRMLEEKKKKGTGTFSKEGEGST